MLTVTDTLIISQLDYYNALYLGLSLETIWEVTGSGVYILGCSQVSQDIPLLYKLCRLPVSFWVQLELSLKA